MGVGVVEAEDVAAVVVAVLPLEADKAYFDDDPYQYFKRRRGASTTVSAYAPEFMHILT